MSLLSYFVFKNNKITFRIIIGLIISTIGALLISMKSISENINFERKEKKENNGKELEDKEEV
jgi:drug/metabolite transporter (DMT)-like permease